jgi:uncharacterized membrane protein
MALSALLLWFCIFSVAGWLWETLFDTIKKGTWQNRGFLFGPLCPIYGVCAVAGVLAVRLLAAAGHEPSALQIFLGALVGSAVVEYVTSYVLERFFHARWWDYSRVPLNINGRVSLPTSVLFGLAGVAVRAWIYPWVLASEPAFTTLVAQLISYVLVAALAADATLTVSQLTSFAKTATALENNVNAHMEALVTQLEHLPVPHVGPTHALNRIKQFSGAAAARDFRAQLFTALRTRVTPAKRQ